MIILAVDPGKTTGWAVMEDARTIRVGQDALPELCQSLLSLPQEFDFGFFVVENYRIRPPSEQRGRNKKFSHAWSEITPAKRIGAVEFAAEIYQIPVVLQEPTIKPLGYRVAGISEGVKARSHAKDAIAHGAYWFHKEMGIRRGTSEAEK